MNYRFDDEGNVLPPQPKSIYEINSYVKELIEEEALLQDIYAVGEISNFKHHYATGHFYLTLKDDKSEIRAVMFRSYASRVKFKPTDGMKVIVHGRIGVYQQGGSYQFYIDSMQPDGVGSLHLAYEQLKAKLDREGLFDASHKKELPKFPSSIGIITSSTGAAIRDIIKVATSRYPCVKLVLFPSLVQGADAPSELIQGLEYFNIEDSVDVIIIGRGGGSLEDLWAFNDEGLARAVYNSKIPVVSAVGHEIDFTICDFVADLRAATPSHAAELTTPNIVEIRNKLDSFYFKAKESIFEKIEGFKSEIEALSKSRCLKNPLQMLDVPSLRLSSLADKLSASMTNQTSQIRERFINANSKLITLNPMAVLSRGYSVVLNDSGDVLKSVDQVNLDENIVVVLKDGKISASVQKKDRSNNHA